MKGAFNRSITVIEQFFFAKEILVMNGLFFLVLQKARLQNVSMDIHIK